MEMVEKIVDAGQMLWQTMNQRERLILLYGVAFVTITVVEHLARGERAKRDERIAHRAAELVRAGR